VIKDGHREETSDFAVLSGCTYNNEICTGSKSIACHLARDITETVT